jgi:uncharacterized protein (DUF1697 family)
LPTFVALLRGINVGKAKQLPMAALRELLAGLGYAEVQTLLNSGNAVFEAKAGSELSHANAIAAAIREQLALEVPVIVKTAKNLALAVVENPYASDVTDHSRLMVVFAPDEATLSGVRSIEAAVEPPERFAVGPHAAYLHCARGILESKAAAALLGKVGKSVTTRNWATTLKLHMLAASGA